MCKPFASAERKTVCTILEPIKPDAKPPPLVDDMTCDHYHLKGRKWDFNFGDGSETTTQPPKPTDSTGSAGPTRATDSTGPTSETVSSSSTGSTGPTRATDSTGPTSETVSSSSTGSTGHSPAAMGVLGVFMLIIGGGIGFAVVYFYARREFRRGNDQNIVMQLIK